MTPKLLPFIQAYLENRPPFYAFIRPQEAFLFQKHHRFLRPPILDFGCGDGFFAQLLFPPGGIQVGLDVAQSRNQEAAATQVYQKLLTYSGTRIPLPKHSFNTVISNCVFEHLSHLNTNLVEIHRLLKPGGYLATTVMTPLWETFLLGSRFFGPPYTRFFRRQQQHLHLLNQSAWDQHFHQAGFEVVETSGYLHSRPAHLDEIFHYLALPALLSYRLTGRWVLWPHWYRWFHFDRLILNLIRDDLASTTSTPTALFYLLRKV